MKFLRCGSDAILRLRLIGKTSAQSQMYVLKACTRSIVSHEKNLTSFVHHDVTYQVMTSPNAWACFPRAGALHEIRCLGRVRRKSEDPRSERWSRATVDIRGYYHVVSVSVSQHLPDNVIRCQSRWRQSSLSVTRRCHRWASLTPSWVLLFWINGLWPHLFFPMRVWRVSSLLTYDYGPILPSQRFVSYLASHGPGCIKKFTQFGRGKAPELAHHPVLISRALPS